MDEKPPGTAEFRVYLPAALVSRIKHRAIDEGRDLTAVVEAALSNYLAQPVDLPEGRS